MHGKSTSLRDQFPITREWTYFDHATYGPHPRTYVEELARAAEELAEQPLGSTSAGVEKVRESAAALLHAPVDQVALLRSTGEGTNLVATGVRWEPGDEVILYELDFPGLIAPWLALNDQGVQVRVVQDRGRNRFDVDDFEQLLSPRTRAMSVSLVNNITGFRAPVKQLGELCREHNIWFTVDAVQALGSIDVDALSLVADVVVSASYKFLLSDFGQAVAYLSERALSELKVPHVGTRNLQMSGSGTLFETGLNLFETARKFEPSNPNLPAMFAMRAAIDLLLELGVERIESHNRNLCAQLTRGLQAKGYTLITSQRETEWAGLVCAVHPIVSSEQIQADLAAQHVLCAVRHGHLRFAPHVYNTPDEVDQILQALPG
ncbi:MAG TPA: aminotransferase class V-fold PLP-dependent enzyme [Chloroflexota bacterium]